MTTGLFDMVWRPVRIIAWAALVFLSLSISGCGGGSTDIAASDGGISGTGVVFGRINGFGSVIVNGTRFDTDDAVIVLNGVEQASQDVLTESMLLRVEGEWEANGQGSAVRVDYSDDVLGPVQGTVAYDPLTGLGAMTVLGQAVQFNEQTVFRGAARETVSSGDYLRISGWHQQNGEIQASLVQSFGTFPGDGAAVRVKGVISTLDTAAETFSIGGLGIGYAGASISMANGRNTLESADTGAFVEAAGLYQGGVLLADDINGAADGNRLLARAGDDIDLEGPVSAVDSLARTFVIDSVTVRMTDNTVFDDDLREADISAGLYVDVKGVWNDTGELVAVRIESRNVDSMVEAGIISILDAAGGRLDVGGVHVQVVAHTLMMDDDDDGANEGHLDFSQLLPGDFLEVDGIRREAGDGSVYLEALRIEREDDGDEYELEGRVDQVDVAAGQFEVIGLTLSVDGATEWDDGLDDIGDLQTGDRVEVEYEARNGGYYVLEIELEDD